MSKPYPEHLKQKAREMYIPGVFGAKRVGEILGVPATTIFRWVNPAYDQRSREKAAINKLKYRGSCIDCGAATAYSGKNMRIASERCDPCYRAYRSAHRKWDRDSIIAAIQGWHRSHGKRPSPTDWIRAGPDHPAVTGIYQGPNPHFSSWGDALRAAGYKDVRFSPGPGKQMFDRREAQRMRQQMTDVEIARHFGVSSRAIHGALGPRVVEPRGRPRPKARTAEQRRQEAIAALHRALSRQTPSAP
jgi:hypothetical protein